MNDQLFEELMMLHNRVCSALDDPKRLMILYMLYEHPSNVKELTLMLDMPQPTISRHLAILRERSLVKTQRDGAAVLYSLSDRRIIQALDLMRDVLRDVAQYQINLTAFTALNAGRGHTDDTHDDV